MKTKVCAIILSIIPIIYSCNSATDKIATYYPLLYINYNDTVVNIDKTWFSNNYIDTINQQSCQQITDANFLQWLHNNDFIWGWSDYNLTIGYYSSKDEFMNRYNDADVIFYNMGQCCISDNFDSYLIAMSLESHSRHLWGKDEYIFVFNIKGSQILSIIIANKYWCYSGEESGFAYTHQVSKCRYCYYEQWIDYDIIYTEREDIIKFRQPREIYTYNVNADGFVCNVEFYEEEMQDASYWEKNNTADLDISVDKLPEFEGDIKDFILSNINYPKELVGDSMCERVVVSLEIDTLGNTHNHAIVTTDNQLLNEEALRVARLIIFKTPAIKKDKFVPYKMNIPIYFNHK